MFFFYFNINWSVPGISIQIFIYFELIDLISIEVMGAICHNQRKSHIAQSNWTLLPGKKLRKFGSQYDMVSFPRNIDMQYGLELLLSPQVTDPESHEEVEDLSYVTIKDSQHRLEEGNLYSVVHFTGSDVFIFT